ncbi:MAG TPA: hypothetical protein PLQ97_06085 [Myxococcota bacterium]|nr:hypothetical protein [Myxococcota bacterium]HQK50231.1 hypothetical protein [Myxococcota bacterium]
MFRFLVPLAMLTLAACSKAPAPVRPEAPSAPVAQAKTDAPEPPPAAAPDAAQAPAVPAPPAEAEGAQALDRDALARCYTAVYCAQKKGEMSRILSIYKEFGFETPQAFTKAWIEAAKDTEWVTRMAYDVSKKCP